MVAPRGPMILPTFRESINIFIVSIFVFNMAVIMAVNQAMIKNKNVSLQEILKCVAFI